MQLIQISKAKSSFLSNLVTESSANPRTFCITINMKDFIEILQAHFQSPQMHHPRFFQTKLTKLTLLASASRNLGFICHSMLYPNLVIFTSNEFFLILQPPPLQIHLSLANLTTVNHFTLASHKQISTNFNAFKTNWHASLQTLQNNPTSTLKKLHWLFQSNNLFPIKQPSCLSFPSHSVLQDLLIHSYYYTLIIILLF